MCFIEHFPPPCEIKAKDNAGGEYYNPVRAQGRRQYQQVLGPRGEGKSGVSSSTQVAPMCQCGLKFLGFSKYLT